MAKKSAQEKFNEYLDECRETNEAVNQFVNSSFENYKSYAYAAGSLATIVNDLIRDLPRAKRAAMREQFKRMTDKQNHEFLIKTIKAD